MRTSRSSRSSRSFTVLSITEETWWDDAHLDVLAFIANIGTVEVRDISTGLWNAWKIDGYIMLCDMHYSDYFFVLTNAFKELSQNLEISEPTLLLRLQYHRTERLKTITEAE
jgi:hypothetical protein